jgi:hypothetical protein
MGYAHALGALLWSYFFGILVGNVLFLPLTNVLFIPSILGGIILALPLLVIAFVTLTAFRRHIDNHLLGWCVVTPFVMTGGWIVFEQYAIFARQGLGFERYLNDPAAHLRAALAFTCAAIAAAKFYSMREPA